MPQAVVLIAQAVTSAAVAFGATSAGALLAASYVGLAVGYAAVGFALNKAMSFLAPKPKSGAGRGLEVAMTDSAAEGFIIYGRVRVSGVNVIPPLSSGNEGRYLHQVVALAIHEVDGYEDVYFNQDVIANSAIGAVSGGSSDGAVSSTAYAGSAWIRRYRGTTTQNVDFILNAAFPSAFTSNFRGRGIAYAAIQYDWGRGRVYTGGVPLTTFVVRGKKCYDPRLDTSPGANPTNASYAAWTENPALCWADYMMASYGYALPSTRIDWSSVVTAANECDELVNIPGSTTQKRYTLNGRLSTATDPEANMRAIIDAMLGKVSDSGGVYRIFAGAWRAPEFTIAKEDWLQINAIQTTAPRNEGRYNGVVCYIVNPSRNWQRVETYRRFSNTYQSADGGERIWIETEQPLCTSEYEGQRKAEFILRQSRNGIIVSGTLPPRFMKLRMWDNVTLDFDELGWVSKTFTVSGFRLAPNGTVEVVLTEEQESDWTDLAAGEYSTPSSASLPATNPTRPSAPQDFTITPQYGTILVEFNEPVVRPADTNYRLIRAVQSLATPTNTVVWEGTSRRFLHETDPRSPFWWFIQAVTNSYVSDYTPNTFGIPAQSFIRPGQIQGAKLNPDPEFYAATQSYWFIDTTVDTRAVTFNPSNGFTTTRGKATIVMSHTDAITQGAYGLVPDNLGQIPDPSFGRTILPIIPGRTLVGICRWRRITGVSTTIDFALTVEAYRYFAANSLVGLGSALLTDVNVQTTTLNQWQTSVVSLVLSNSMQNYGRVTGSFVDELFLTSSGQVEIGELGLYMF